MDQVYQQSSYFNKGSYSESASEVVSIHLETDKEAQELQQLMEWGGIALVFQRWIQLQVTQWAALDILLSYSHQAAIALWDTNMSISLLSMRHYSPHKMKNWQYMIKELIGKHLTGTCA